MKIKNVIITILIAFVSLGIVYASSRKEKLLEPARTFYQVYLNDSSIGAIDDKDKLYQYIDKNQASIKEQYGVDTVYPPTSLKVVKTNSFKTKTSNIKEVYDQIEEKDSFAIQGYQVEIKGDNGAFYVYVLDKDVFYNAAKRFVKAFLDENEYENYIENTQEEITDDVGRKIEKMYFKENITIKEDFISVNEKIYTDEIELSQYLLFGDNPDTKTYTVKLGDTISSISEANKLNSEEFLIANPEYKTEDVILRVGDQVNVTLINPKLTYIYDLYEVSDEIVYYMKKTVYDNTKYVGYREVTTPGQNGINRVTEKYSVTNGEREQGVDPIKTVTIRESRDQITTVGTKVNRPIGGGGHPVEIDGDWAWPTNSGYVITSHYGWRWGRMHNGMDISGAGNFGSNIYAAGDGTVVKAFNGCPSNGYYGNKCGGELGNMIIIDHGNNTYTTYAHLHQTIKVSVGSTVKRGQLIGYMGNSGSSTGPHLHFAVSYGSMTSGYQNPLTLYR